MKKLTHGMVTIDVEPDDVWGNPHSQSLTNVQQLPRLQSLCNEFGIQPTFLITYSVAQDRACGSILERLLAAGKCEIGVHPHLWEIPPYTAIDDTKTPVGNTYERSVLEDKIAAIVACVRSRFGTATSHRAGRWGFDHRQAQILIDHGISVDTSVTPGIDWSSTGAPDYSGASGSPYRLHESNICQSGGLELLEVPCTIRHPFAGVKNSLSRKIQLARRIPWMRPQWLRALPGTTSTQLINTCKWARGKYPHLNLMTHSSELMPGGSPYWATGNEVDYHFGQLRDVFTWWSENDVRPATLSNFCQLQSVHNALV